MSHECIVIVMWHTQGYRDNVVKQLRLVTEEGWWAQTRVPMLVVAPIHAEDTWLAHWNTLKFGKMHRTYDHHMIII